MKRYLPALVAFWLAIPAVRAAAPSAAAGAILLGREPGAGSREPSCPASQLPSLDTALQHAEIQRDREQLAALRRDLEALRARTAELRAQVDDLHRQIAELNSRLARGPVHARPAPGSTTLTAPGAPPTDATLKSLVQRLIQPAASPEEVDLTAAEITAYVGDDRELQRQAYNAFLLALHLNYGSPHAQEVMRRLQTRWRPSQRTR